MPKERFRFYTERSSFCVQCAVIFMALSAIFRVIGCWGLWNDRYFLMTQIALPIAANLLFILLLTLLGKHAFWATSLPVILGASFFVLKALSIPDTLRMALYLLLYLVFVVVYVGTSFTLIKTRWLLVPLCLGPFLYLVGVEDIARLRDTVNPVTFAEGMQEMSVLCILLALFFTALGLKKKDTTPQVDLPKIKGPKVVRPGTAGEPAVPAEKPAEVPAAEPAPAGDKPAEEPVEKTAEKTDEKSDEKSAEEPVKENKTEEAADEK